MSLYFKLKGQEEGKVLEASLILDDSGTSVSLVVEGWHICTLGEDGLSRHRLVPPGIGLQLDSERKVAMNEWRRVPLGGPFYAENN